MAKVGEAMEIYKGSVLLVDDDVQFNHVNSRALELAGYDVYTATTLEKASWYLSWLEPDVILLETLLPDGSGFEFCENIRETTTAHILFLTAKKMHEDMIYGMQVGGDDYFTKSVHLEELLVKIRAIMRRRMSESYQLIKKGNLLLDVATIQAFNGNDPLRLTPIEFSLLLMLAQNEGRTLSCDDIYERVWHCVAFNNKNTLQAAISKLRRKIATTGYQIISQRNQGYVFEKA